MDCKKGCLLACDDMPVPVFSALHFTICSRCHLHCVQVSQSHPDRSGPKLLSCLSAGAQIFVNPHPQVDQCLMMCALPCAEDEEREKAAKAEGARKEKQKSKKAKRKVSRRLNKMLHVLESLC